jgi:hypothetical protein
MSDNTESGRTGAASAIAVVFAIAAALVFWFSGQAKAELALVVKVDPAGATVRLVEPHMPEGTTVEVRAASGVARFEGLPAGERVRATASAKGFVQAVIDETLPAKGPEHTVSVKLKRETGLYTVRTEPAGALLYLDGKPVGQAPRALTDVTPGAHELSAHLEGFEKGELSFVAEAGGYKELVITLVALPAADGGPSVAAEDKGPADGYGRIVGTSTHEARWLMNNYVLGVGKRVLRDVPPGTHRITAKAEGRGTKYKMIDVDEGETLEVEFEFLEDPLEKALDATDPSKPIYWTVRGGTIRNEGRYGAAIEHFNKALELDPEDITAHRQLSRTYPALKDWDKAIFHAKRYLELEPAAPDAEFTEGLIEEMEKLKLSGGG